MVLELRHMSNALTDGQSLSPIVSEGEKFGLRAGEVMDLATGWDFRWKDDRERAWKYVSDNRPMLIVGSPRCAMFSKLQNLTPWTQET